MNPIRRHSIAWLVFSFSGLAGSVVYVVIDGGLKSKQILLVPAYLFIFILILLYQFTALRQYEQHPDQKNTFFLWMFSIKCSVYLGVILLLIIARLRGWH